MLARGGGIGYNFAFARKPLHGMNIKISPSLLSANFADLKHQIRDVEQAGADWLHCDVMDGHFVPNLTIGPFIIQAIKSVANVPLDVHIMISEPERYAPEFCKAGADILTFHIEAAKQPRQVIDIIRKHHVKPAVAISPDTPAESVDAILSDVSMVLVMTVHPGFGGQSFMPQCLEKVRRIRDKVGDAIDIQVDGGLSAKTVAAAAAAGANVIVAGTSIFKADDPARAIRELRGLAAVNLAVGPRASER